MILLEKKKERYHHVLFDVVEGFSIMLTNSETDINHLYIYVIGDTFFLDIFSLVLWSKTLSCFCLGVNEMFSNSVLLIY